MYEQAEITNSIEKVISIYPRIKLSDLIELVAEDDAGIRIAENWGYDRLAEMVNFGLGFARKNGKYVVGQPDEAKQNGPLSFLHFKNWIYEDKKIEYAPQF